MAAPGWITTLTAAQIVEGMTEEGRQYLLAAPVGQPHSTNGTVWECPWLQRQQQWQYGMEGSVRLVERLQWELKIPDFTACDICGGEASFAGHLIGKKHLNKLFHRLSEKQPIVEQKAGYWQIWPFVKNGWKGELLFNHVDGEVVIRRGTPANGPPIRVELPPATPLRPPRAEPPTPPGPAAYRPPEPPTPPGPCCGYRPPREFDNLSTAAVFDGQFSDAPSDRPSLGFFYYSEFARDKAQLLQQQLERYVDSVTCSACNITINVNELKDHLVSSSHFRSLEKRVAGQLPVLNQAVPTTVKGLLLTLNLVHVSLEEEWRA
ncbi:unnamed protein product [Symbiodinium sp. CCMP2592]|nr:unnamed protein product [Symbiodinium sp. CCMP2592]